MSAIQQWSRATAEERLGPAAVAAARRVVDAAPPLSVEQREQLRAVFATARPRPVAGTSPARKAA